MIAKNNTWDGFLKMIGETAGTDLYHEMYGNGAETLLMIHGYGLNRYTWRHLVRPLSERYKVILLDLKGAGKSPKPVDSDYSVYRQAVLVVHFIRKHDLWDLTIVAHSYGGGISLIVSLYLLKEKQGRLKRLILLDNPAYAQELPPFINLLTVPLLGKLSATVVPATLLIKEALKSSYYDKGKIAPDAVSAYAKPLDEAGGRHALIETARRMIPADLNELSKRYGEIDIPVLIIWGEDDEVVLPEVGRRLNDQLPDARIEIIGDCGHLPQEEKPEGTLQLITNFIEKT